MLGEKDCEENKSLVTDMTEGDGEEKNHNLSRIGTSNGQEFNLLIPSEFDFCVANAQKSIETMESYLTFEITTKSRLNRSSEFKVRRRFRHFLFLHLQLKTIYPLIILPPPPEKHHLKNFELDKFNNQFINKRMLALRSFLKRISHDPLLSTSNEFNNFLTTNIDQYVPYMSDWEGKNSISSSSSPAHECYEEQLNRFSRDVLTRTKISFNRIGEFNQIVVQCYRHINTFVDRLSRLKKLFDLIMREREGMKTTNGEIIKELDELINDNSDYQFRLPQNLEDVIVELDVPTLNDQLIKIDTQSTFQLSDKEFNRLIQLIHDVFSEEQFQMNRLDFDVLDNIHLMINEHILYGQQVKRVVEMVEQFHHQFNFNSTDNTTATTNSNKEKMEQWSKVEDFVIYQLCKWNEIKVHDFKSIFNLVVQSQLDYYQQMLDVWEKTLSELNSN
ncbi:hypothetical protein SNEBB_004935 [Seison nebaliae]|nr:hypothetical protein SNEBB_004935 [Seison nebaliae]